MTTRSTAIFGGGIAGAALALGLTQRGLPVTVHERDGEHDRRGFGFLLLENGLAALEALNLGHVTKKLARPLERIVLRATDGRVLREAPLAGAAAVCRTELHEAILGALPAGVMRFGQGLDDLAWEGDVAHEALLHDGTRIAADVFVGADGIRSRCRDALGPPATSRPGRVKELVAAIHAPRLYRALDRTFVKHFAAQGGLAVGLVPCRGERVIWFVQFDAERFPAPTRGEASRFYREVLRGFPAEVAHAVDATPDDAAYLWNTLDVDPLPSVARGNVALLGDAAQPLLPFTSQGANTGLEGAVRLARVLADAESPEALHAAFGAYADDARARAVRLVREGRLLARSFLAPPVDAAPLPLVS